MPPKFRLDSLFDSDYEIIEPSDNIDPDPLNFEVKDGARDGYKYAEKIKKVEELNGIFLKAKSAVLANYQGIEAAELTRLRSHMRGRAIDFRVVKNTLAKQAAKNTPFELLDGDFTGPVSLVLSFEDAVAPAKALR